MYRPYYYKRKQLPPVEEDDTGQHEDFAPYSNKTLCLGIVHPGSYEPWMVFSEKTKAPLWTVNIPISRVELESESCSESMLSETTEETGKSGSLRNTSKVRGKVDSLDDPDEFITQLKKDLDLENQMLRLLRIAQKTARENWIKTPFKLVGLEGRGEAEVLKLLFLVADQAVDDERITAEQTEELKGQTPYGEYPTIAKCGLTFGNATAMSMALATKFQLFGETVQEQLVVGAIYSRLRHLQDRNKRTLAWIMCGQMKDKAKIEWAQGQLLHVILPPAIKEWDKQICSTKGPFLVESGMTLADIAIMDFLDHCSSHVVIDGLLADYLAVSDLLEAVRSCPKLLAHLQDMEED